MNMEIKEYKGLVGAIILQAIEDFERKPLMRTEIEAFFKSSWGNSLMTVVGLSFEDVDRRLKITEVNKKHKLFHRAYKTVEGLSGQKPTIKQLAVELNWDEADVEAHVKEYDLPVKGTKKEVAN